MTDDKINTYFKDVVFNVGIGFVEVKDRDVVQDGDIVVTDYTGYLDGKAFQGGSTISADGKSDPAWIDVSKNCGVDPNTGSSTSSFITGFSKGLLGAKIGQKTSSEVTFPADYGNAELAGKLTTFEFDVKAIYTTVTPSTITDAMVEEKFKESDGITTVAGLMELIKKELAYNLVINSVVENSTFDISDEYLELRLDEYQALFEALYCTNTDINTFLNQYYGVDLEKARAQWKPSLLSQIKGEVVMAAIVKEEKLKTDKAALEEYVKSVMEPSGSSQQDAFFSKEENVYKMLGVGNAEIGKEYYLNQNAVSEFIMENYK
jgi:FKBP-type peptidyl-prolyl cis-trans isomerase (trigger factor)